MNKMLPGLVLSAFALLFFGCGQPPEDSRFYFISGSSGSDVDFFVNGNPTNRGNALMLFLVDGWNTIELKGDFSESGYQVQVFRGRSLLDVESQFIVNQQEGALGEPDDGVIDFQAEIDDQWAWESGDVFGTLSTKDRTAIYALYDSICDEMQSDGFTPKGLMNRRDVAMWSASHKHRASMERRLKELGAKIPPRSELVFQKASHDEVRLLPGKQLVMLSCDQKKLVYLGPAENDKQPEDGEIRWSFYYGFSEMFFAKIDGSWTLLIPNL